MLAGSPLVHPLCGSKVFGGVWQSELIRLKSLIETALADPSPLNLFNSVLSLLCAPGSTVGSLFNNEVKSSLQFSSSDGTVNSVLRKIVKGQEGKAFKTVLEWNSQN